MVTELTLLRLPPPLADAVDKAVAKFVDRSPSIRAQRRRAGADLWIIYTDQPNTDYEEAGFVTRRVTVAAYSDSPGTLAFIADILRTAPQGRYALPPEQVAEAVLRMQFFEWGQMAGSPVPADTFTAISKLLDEAWTRASSFKLDEARVPLT